MTDTDQTTAAEFAAGDRVTMYRSGRDAVVSWQATAARRMVRATPTDTGRPTWFYPGEVYPATGERGPVEAARARLAEAQRMADDLDAYAITPRDVLGTEAGGMAAARERVAANLVAAEAALAGARA